MNIPLLKSEMVAAQDTQAKLAEAMGLSLSRLNAKINGYQGAEFNQAEIAFLIKRYHLSADKAQAIFFAECVS